VGIQSQAGMNVAPAGETGATHLQNRSGGSGNAGLMEVTTAGLGQQSSKGMKE